MPRPSKGARLYLREPRSDKGSGAVYVIRDGSKEVSTGCGPNRLEDAQRCLAAYIADKWSPTPTYGGPVDPSEVSIAEVVGLYLAEVVPGLAQPGGVKPRLKALVRWWGEKSVADIRPSTCRAYVADRQKEPIRSFKNASTARRVSEQSAGRELEDLSAAVGHWHKEQPFTRKPTFWFPEKPESPRDAMTRDQAARLLRAARGWRWDADSSRWIKLGRSAAANRAHLPRFILIGLYTGTRPGVIPKLLWHESPTQAWVDLEKGMIWRRGRREREHATKRRPVVRLPDRLLAHMRRWQRRDAEKASARAERGAERQACSAVLHHGGKSLAGRVRTGFEGCVADAGLASDVTPHWMRHTCATWLMEADVSSWEAAAYLGMTVATLEKHYGHHRPSAQQNARRGAGRGGRAA